MKDVTKGHARTSRHSRSQRSAAANDSAGRRPRTILAWLVSIALVVLLTVAFVRSGKGPDPVLTDSISDPVPARSHLQPTIVLPSEEGDVTAEQLRAELLRLGEELLARFPKAPESLHVVALLYADLQKTTEADKIWRECIPLAPLQAGPYVGLARVAMDLGKDEEAVQILKQARVTGCSTPDLFNQLAIALTKLGMLEQAAQVAHEGLGQFPDAVEVWIQCGQIQIQLNQFAEAEVSLRKAIELGATSDTLYFALATAYARQGKQEEAAKYRQEFANRKKASSIGPNERFQTRYDAEMRHLAATSIYRVGMVYDAHSDSAQAEKMYLRAIGLAPTDAVICKELAGFYRRVGRLADARVVQRRLVELDPRQIVQHLNLASLSQQLGDDEGAENDLKHAIQNCPELAIGYSSLARVYLQRGDNQQARTLAEEALKHQTAGPDEVVTTYLVLATACRQVGDLAAAEATLTKARQFAPNDPRLR
jgi:tetratricopeptide (TPR) repeat protein